MSYRDSVRISPSPADFMASSLKQGEELGFSRTDLLRALAEFVPENIKTDDGSFPSLVLAPDLIPKYTDKQGSERKWEMTEDVPPSEFEVADLKFRSFLKKKEYGVSGETMRKRAVAMKGNLGLADAKRFLAEQKKIPQELRGLYVVFPGTVLRGPHGYLHVACLSWGGCRWSLDWRWLGHGWRDDVRFACSE